MGESQEEQSSCKGWHCTEGNVVTGSRLHECCCSAHCSFARGLLCARLWSKLCRLRSMLSAFLQYVSCIVQVPCKVVPHSRAVSFTFWASQQQNPTALCLSLTCTQSLTLPQPVSQFTLKRHFTFGNIKALFLLTGKEKEIWACTLNNMCSIPEQPASAHCMRLAICTLISHDLSVHLFYHVWYIVYE